MVIEDLHIVNPYQGLDELSLRVEGWNHEDILFEKLIEEIRPELIVEVGSWLGGSAITMCNAIRKLDLQSKICCVDTWLGSIEFWLDKNDPIRYKSLNLKNGYPSCYYQFLSNIKRLALEDLVIPFPQSSSIAARWFEINQIHPQLIYLDASHETKDVLNDLENWFDILDFNGILFGDDWNWSSVREAVQYFCNANNIQAKIENNKWIIKKEPIKDIGYIISSNVNYLKPLQNLLNSMTSRGIRKDRIFVGLGGAKEDKFTSLDELSVSYCTHNSFDYTGSIEFCKYHNQLQFPEHVILLHDTMEFTDKTEEAIKRVNSTKLATSASLDLGGGMCNLMILKQKYLLEKKEVLDKLINCSKQGACAAEGFLFKICPIDKKGHFHSTKVTFEEPRNVFGAARRKEFYHGPQIIKYKGNWGQSNCDWVLTP
jgi:hypothetical protein